MRKIALAIFYFALVAVAGAADSARQPYVSRYKEWVPHVSNTLVATISVGGGPRGLWSGSFSAHLFPREPDAIRSDGTPVTAHALLTMDEMKAMLKLTDGIGAFATFSSCVDDNWREPEGEPTRIQIVWRPENGTHRYDWFVVSRARMRDFLKTLSDSVHSQEAVVVVKGLIDGYNSVENGEKPGANKPSEGTR